MDDTVKTGKQLAQVAMDLTDEEISKTVKIVNGVRLKYTTKPNTVYWLECLRDEVVTKLAGVGILATLDPAPCYYGEPPIIEIIGKVSGDPIHDHGMDHERKQYEVREATRRGEDYRGQKER